MNIKSFDQPFKFIVFLILSFIFIAQISAQTDAQKESANAEQDNVRIRIGIANRDWTTSDTQVSAASLKLTELLAGSETDTYDAVILTAKLDSLIIEEAQAKKCNYILYIDAFSSEIKVNKSKNFLVVMAKDKAVIKLNDLTGRLAGKASRAAPAAVTNLAKTARNSTAGKLKKPAIAESEETPPPAAITSDSPIDFDAIFKHFAENTKDKNKVSIVFTLYSFEQERNLVEKREKTQTATRDMDNLLERVLVDTGNDVLKLIPKK